MNSGDHGQAGLTYLAVLLFIAASSAALAVTASIWSHQRQREKEQELLWVGTEFREAIAVYYLRSPGVVRRYPESLEDLLEDRRFLSMQRHLRRIYRDPMTGTATWGLVVAPEGGIKGVHSLSEDRPIKIENFDDPYNDFRNGKRYSDWKFIYEPPPPSTKTRELKLP